MGDFKQSDEEIEETGLSQRRKDTHPCAYIGTILVMIVATGIFLAYLIPGMYSFTLLFSLEVSFVLSSQKI